MSPFENLTDVEALVGLVMRHYNDALRALDRRGRYSPILEVDPQHDETLWELWIDGFARAVQLRPQGWARIVESDDDDARLAYFGLLLLHEINQGSADLPDEEINAIDKEAEDLIPMWVEVLHTWRRNNDGSERMPSLAPRVRTKVGRNDPCPCGSGKKYKKCCGLN